MGKKIGIEDGAVLVDPENENNEATKGRLWSKTRKNLSLIMHSKKVHAVSMTLLVIDAILVLVLLLVDLNAIPVLEEADHSKREKVENGLHYTSLSILSVFVIEIILKVVADGSKFFESKLEVFDAIIVLVSFVLDIALSMSNVSNFVRDAVILMVLLRLWRFVRLLFTVGICARADVQDHADKEKELRIQAEAERDKALKLLKEAQHESTTANKTSEGE